MADRGLAEPLRWESFHLHDLKAPDVFLVETLLPLMQHWEQDGMLNRWFFIRYDDLSGPHLRLRLHVPTYVCRVSSTLDRQLGALAVRVIRCPYDRAQFYFGENWTSVRSESLNVASTQLALAVLQAAGSSRPHTVMAACAALLVLDAEVPAVTQEYRRFLELHCGSSGLNAVLPYSAATQLTLLTLASDLRSLPVMRLFLRRLSAFHRRGALDLAMCSHGLHLLMNKAGFTLTEEVRNQGKIEGLAL